MQPKNLAETLLDLHRSLKSQGITGDAYQDQMTQAVMASKGEDLLALLYAQKIVAEISPGQAEQLFAELGIPFPGKESSSD